MDNYNKYIQRYNYDNVNNFIIIIIIIFLFSANVVKNGHLVAQIKQTVIKLVILTPKRSKVLVVKNHTSYFEDGPFKADHISLNMNGLNNH